MKNICFLAYIFLCFFLFSCTNNEEAIRYLQSGKEAYNKKDYSQALDCFTKSISLDPKNNESHRGKITTLYALKNYEEAIKECDILIKHDKKDSTVYFLRALANRELKNYNAVVDDLSKSLEINPYDKKALSMRGCAYWILEQSEKAIDDFTYAIRIKGHGSNELSDLYLSRGINYYKLEKYTNAYFDLTDAISVREDLYEAYVYRGMCNNEQKDYELAIKDFSVVIERDPDPDKAQVYYERGNAYHMLGKNKLAVLDWKKAINLDPQKYKDIASSKIIMYDTK